MGQQIEKIEYKQNQINLIIFGMNNNHTERKGETALVTLNTVFWQYNLRCRQKEP